ncbi:MAG: hypothetical protein NTX66_03070 [Candidatus Falkowbacteria bacterium]|nr:hypothetical protein [Candidatus Falkowbacteria bacterium]
MLGKVCYRFRGEFDSEPSKTKPAMILSMFIANLFFSWIFIWPVLSFDFAWKIAVVNIVLSLLLFKLAYVIDKWTDQKNQIDHVEVLK